LKHALKRFNSKTPGGQEGEKSDDFTEDDIKKFLARIDVHNKGYITQA